MRQKFVRVLSATILALAIFLGVFAHKPAPAAAYGYSVGISDCSWAQGYCTLRFCAYTSGTVYLTWYVTTQGYSGYRSTQVESRNGCFIISSTYIGQDTHADFVYVSCPQICERFELYVQW